MADNKKTKPEAHEDMMPKFILRAGRSGDKSQLLTGLSEVTHSEGEASYWHPTLENEEGPVIHLDVLVDENIELRSKISKLKKRVSDIKGKPFDEVVEDIQRTSTQAEISYEEPTEERISLFDGFIALSCSAERAECALAELDYMWDTVWSVRFPNWFAHLVSIKNALAIGLGGLLSRLAKIGFIAGIVGAVKSLFGNYSI